jgi:hypothetical protein
VADQRGDAAAVQVEGKAKQYPRRIFDGSPVFADMLALPQPTGQPVEGETQAHPLRLDGVRLKEMGQFACVVEARYVKVTPSCIHALRFSPNRSMQSIPRNLPAQEWVNVLRLASMWEMDALRTHIIDHLTMQFEETMNGADAAIQVRAALDYGVEEWKLAGLFRLIGRPYTLSAADLRALGPDLAAVVLHQRDSVFTQEKIDAHQNIFDAVRDIGECACEGLNPVMLCRRCEDAAIMRAQDMLQLKS